MLKKEPTIREIGKNEMRPSSCSRTTPPTGDSPTRDIFCRLGLVIEARGGRFQARAFDVTPIRCAKVNPYTSA
jgi:hypothetical protein